MAAAPAGPMAQQRRSSSSSALNDFNLDISDTSKTVVK